MSNIYIEMTIFSKSLASMRQKLRKYLKDFEDDVGKFRENPEQPDDDEDDDKRKFQCQCLN